MHIIIYKANVQDVSLFPNFTVGLLTLLTAHTDARLQMDLARLNARSKLTNKQRDFTDKELGRQSQIRNTHLRYGSWDNQTKCWIYFLDKMHYHIYDRCIRRQNFYQWNYHSRVVKQVLRVFIDFWMKTLDIRQQWPTCAISQSYWWNKFSVLTFLIFCFSFLFPFSPSFPAFHSSFLFCPSYFSYLSCPFYSSFWNLKSLILISSITFAIVLQCELQTRDYTIFESWVNK